MGKQFNDNDLIERFLDGSLSEKEREAFNERIKTDTILADALAQRKLLQRTYIETSRRSALKKQIKTIVTDEKRKAANQRKVWLAAATIIVLTAVGSILMFPAKKPDNAQRLANEQPKQSIDTTDHLLQGQQKSMNEYATLDSIEATKKNNTLYPDDRAILKSGDTIRFSWPELYKVQFLTIYNNKGEVVKKESIIQGTNKYVLLPGMLPPGQYSWKILKDSKNIHFTINN